MKKITLALFAVVYSLGSVYGQATYSHPAPPNNNTTSSFRAPNGTQDHAYQRTVMYIHPYEMLPMNLATFTSMGFQYTSGTGSIPVTGNFTVWLQNTTDFDYAKGTNFTTALTGMQQVYSGPFTVPGAAGPSTVNINFTNTFNFTGDGLYVAYDWDSAGPFAAAGATYACNNTEVQIATASSSVNPISNTLAGSNFRPSIIWGATNTATNEIEVIDVMAPGRIAKLYNTPHVITSKVVNSSIGAQNNVSVTLNVTGPNAFTDVQVLNMTAGQISTVSFNPYNPTVNGLNSMSVTVTYPNPDQNTANNRKVWTQSVTCNEIAQNYPNPAWSSSYGFTAPGGLFLTKHTPPTASTLQAVRVYIGSNTGNTGKSLHGVLVDAAGVTQASTNAVGITPSGNVMLTFNPPQALTAGTDYYIGVIQPSFTTGYFPMAYIPHTTFVSPVYYTRAIGGGVIGTSNTGGYMGMEPILSFSNVAASIAPSTTVVCKGQSLSLVAGGGLTTYTWSTGAQTTSIVVTPTIAGASGAVQYTLTGTDGVSNCKSANAVVTISVSACTGLASNNNGVEVKLFPNPTVSGKSTITGLVGTNVITVFNALGQIVLTQTVSDENATLDLSNQAAGNYMVKITDASNESRILKVINQN